METKVFRHAHLACGIGAGARGFNMANPRIGNVSARFECAGGIDVDAAAIANFEKLTGAKGTVMDLFNREQFIAFHGHEPPHGWTEATPADVYRAFGPALDVCFASMPCKGFSGLLSQKQSETDRYQALNGLTLRGVWLLLEAYKDEPIPIVLFENVPRIANRGRWLLDQIVALLRHYGYAVAESVHDCGELGGLAQSRKRFLLVARHQEKVPPFVYEPIKRKLRGVGEVIGKLPLPGDPIGGPMHRVPALQWQTWVRLAFVPAGKDWRALNELEVVDGHLRDFGIVPEIPLRDNALGVLGWDETARLVTGARAPGQGRFSIADPRIQTDREGTGRLGVRAWNETSGTVAGASRPENGAFSVADPRVDGHPRSVQLGVRPWDQAAPCVKGDMPPGGGPYAVADPRMAGRARFNNTFRIVPFDQPTSAVAGPGGPAGGHCVADPRATDSPGYKKRKYRVTRMDEPAGAVIAASTTGNGAFAVADPRAALGVDGKRQNYQTSGHYGVVDWKSAAGTVSATASHDNGRGSVADPRDVDLDVDPIPLPQAKDRMVCRIVSLDETWHRPFTTLELAALQSIVDPEEAFGVDQDGRWFAREGFDLLATSDATKREWIGNAVPSAASQGMATTIGETLLLAGMGETFMLSSREIWVKPLALALAVDTDQLAVRMDGGLA
jgi:site-specific DNA-cytosine methylase